MQVNSRRMFATLLALLALPGLSPFDVVPAARSSDVVAASSPSPVVDVDVAPLIEARAVALATELGVVTLGHGAPVCPADRLYASWADPVGVYEVGAYLAPVGPRPTAGTTEVNGIVFCRDSSYAYMGFEASRTGGEWLVTAVPVIPHEEHEEENEPDDAPAPAPADAPTPPPVSLPQGIEGYAAYEGQSTCDPSPKPGVFAFRDTVLRQYPWTRSSGISRGCSVGGRSEHKEGRAWDWAVNVNRPDDKRAADEVVGWLLATDPAGNAHAMARRTGLMYVIWNRQMWAAYRAGAGWRSYQGPSAHTDHVHFSFSWAGARAQTSFFSGIVADLPTVIPVSSPSGGGDGGGRRPAEADAPRRRHRPPTTSTSVPELTEPREPRESRPRRRERPTTTTTTTDPPEPRVERRHRRDRDRDRDHRRRHDRTTTTTIP